MSIFGNIMSAIFGQKGSQPAPGTTAAAPGATKPSTPASGAGSGPTATAAPGSPQAGVDVEAVLVKMAKDRGQNLNWRQSIVDLMKLLDLDSSLSARKELAQELGYKGALDGSAEMNIWLHKQVMRKLAENGGKVPDSLRT
jgi:hypothetical protein